MGGGPVGHSHNPYWKWYQTIPLYTHSLPLIFVEQIFSFEGARPEKGIKIWPLNKNLTKILIFEYFRKIPSEMHSNFQLVFVRRYLW